jgi:hypothetical protein
MHRPSLALAILALVAVGPVLGAEERAKHPPRSRRSRQRRRPATLPKPPAPTFDFATS